MAHSNRITAWLLKNARSAGISVEHATWTREVLPQITDITVSIQYNLKNVYGSGAARNEELALNKALAEAAERVVMLEQGLINSNGLAAHSDSELAREASINELRERDLFLCHYLTRTPFTRISHHEVTYPELDAWLKTYGIKQQLFYLGSEGIVFVLDGRMARDPFGFIISLSHKESFSENLDSVVISASRTAHRLKSKQKSLHSLSLNDFKLIKNPTFKQHGELALDIDFANEIAYLFEGDSQFIRNFNSVVPEITYYQPQLASLRDCPVHVSYAASDKYQKLFCGPPTEKNVNMDRLVAFSGKAFAWSDINPLPHPFN